MANVEATLTYQENCDYLPSSITDELSIDPMEIDIETTLKIPDEIYRKRITEVAPEGIQSITFINGEGVNSSDYEQFKPFYNDTLELIVKTSITHEGETFPVKYSDIDVYYFEEHENRTILNPDDSNHAIATNIQIDKKGLISVRYLPHNSGYFVIHYHETTYFKEKIVEHKVDLRRIPTQVTIKPVYNSQQKEFPIFVHMEDKVKLAASVRDIYGNRPKDGVITFLQYYIDDPEHPMDGYERVIGNPVMLEDGETFHDIDIPLMGNTIQGPDPTQDDWKHVIYDEGAASGYITYSPIQYLYKDPEWDESSYTSQDRTNVEIIKAHYNYDDKNDVYGGSWKYYESHSGQTSISVLLPGKLNLALKKNGLQTGELWQIQESGYYRYTTNDNIIAYVSLADDDGNLVEFNSNDLLYYVNFKLECTESVIENGKQKYIKHEYNIQSNQIENNQFKLNFNIRNGTIDGKKLINGIYNIQASLNMIENKGGKSLQTKYYDYIESNIGYFEIVKENLADYEISHNVEECYYNINNTQGEFLPLEDGCYTVVGYNGDSIAVRENQGVGIIDGKLTTWSFVIWNVVRGKAYLNDGWRNNDNWTIEFDAKEEATWDSPNVLYMIRDINDATYANQLKRCIAIQTNGKIFTCDNEGNQTTITWLDSEFILNNNGTSVHITITRDSNNYQINILNRTTMNECITNFTSDVLNNSSELHLWLTCSSQDRGNWSISNVKLPPHVPESDAIYDNIIVRTIPKNPDNNIDFVNKKMYMEITGKENKTEAQRITLNNDRLITTFDSNIFRLLPSGRYSCNFRIKAGNKEDNLNIATDDEIINGFDFNICLQEGIEIVDLRYTKSIHRGNFEVDIRGINIRKSTPITVELYQNNQLVQNTRKIININNNNINTISYDNIKAGNYLLKATCDKNYDEIEIEIDKATLNLRDESISCLTGQQNININIECNGSIDDLNENKIHILQEKVYMPSLKDINEVVVFNRPELVEVSNNTLISHKEFSNLSHKRGKAYIKQGWNNVEKWKISFQAYTENGAQGSGYVLIKHADSEITQANQLQKAIGFRSGGAIDLFNDLNVGTRVGNNDDNIAWKRGWTEITLEKNNNHYIATLQHVGSDVMRTVEFDWNGFDNIDDLTLVLTVDCSDNGDCNFYGSDMILKNIKYYYKENLPILKLTKINNNAIINTTTLLTTPTNQNIQVIYDEDENYNGLNSLISIHPYTRDGKLKKIDSQTFNINYNGYNNQFIIGILQAKNLNDEICIPIITDVNGNFTINNIDNWESYVEFNFFKDPENQELLELIKQSNTNNIYNDLSVYYEEKEIYETLQANENLAQQLYNQVANNNFEILFTVYNDETIW